MSPISWDDLAARDKDSPSRQVGPFSWHVARQEGEDVPLELAEMNHPAVSGPSTVALEPVELGRLALSRPSMVPLESVGGGHFDLSEPSEPREGSKRQRAEEEQLGSGKPAPKHPRMMASR